MRLNVWSGPRNLSTALLYAFTNRADCDGVDEPFYGAWLARSGAAHPGRAEVLAAMEDDPIAVARACTAPVAPWRIRYMKQMAHHMKGVDLSWAEGCANVHLIRHPARVIASYLAKHETPTIEELGFAAQRRVHARLPGPVIEAEAVRADPRAALQALCADLGLDWSEAMLSWPPGPRPFDGVWAGHWYGAVHRSTGFAGPEGAMPDLTGEAARLCAAVMPDYEALRGAA
ncbi:MAG: sulfotransferase-like domain-containing protein [Paracoccaceae bacterium]